MVSPKLAQEYERKRMECSGFVHGDACMEILIIQAGGEGVGVRGMQRDLIRLIKAYVRVT